MNAQRKHREGWDDGFYLARSDPEREPKPRLEATVVELPKRVYHRNLAGSRGEENLV
jgi:hypothetical protein